MDANLIDSIDLGRLAFLTAEKNMGFVKDVATKIDNKVTSIKEFMFFRYLCSTAPGGRCYGDSNG